MGKTPRVNTKAYRDLAVDDALDFLTAKGVDNGSRLEQFADVLKETLGMVVHRAVAETERQTDEAMMEQEEAPNRGGVFISLEAVFYVRAAMHRGIAELQHINKNAKEYLETRDPKSRTMFDEQLSAMVEYNEQMVRESLEAFKTLPKALWNDALNRWENGPHNR